MDPVGKAENYLGQNHLILCHCEYTWKTVKPLIRGGVSMFTVHLVQVWFAHVVKYSNRRYFLHLMMIQYLPPGLKQILHYFIGLRLKFFDAKELTIRQLHQTG